MITKEDLSMKDKIKTVSFRCVVNDSMKSMSS